MPTLTNKRLLLGITGGIAAYKAPDLVRRLRDAGAEVRVAMTRAATAFITPLTLQAVSGHRVHLDFLDAEQDAAVIRGDRAQSDATAQPMSHIALARWADAVVIAPASANFLAKLAAGRADDLLSTLSLATRSPVAVAPAMNQQMWENAATRDNLAILAKRGIRVFGPGAGSQACGETGLGRMLETAELAELCAGLFATGLLEGKNVLITAGPTWEALDPVRGITNRSSGKMGYAIAAAAAEAGARVTLVSGPVALPDPERVHVIRLRSAEEMFNAVHAHVGDADIFIAAAAVADYRPRAVAPEKIKKRDETMVLELEKNPDILASVAALDAAPFTVGFAAETTDVVENARGKLQSKNVDLIAANQVGIEGSGFEADENRLTLIDDNGTLALPLRHKSQLARELIIHIAQRYHEKNRSQSARPAHRR